MKFHTHYIILLITLFSCKSSIDKKQQARSVQLARNDSSKLIHVKNQFYKDTTGHLYELTWAQKEVKGVDTLVWYEYFNKDIPQFVDPLTFEELNGWYAKDKDHAYFYRPTSGGMQMIKIDGADVRSFDLLQGHYDYAYDKKNVYHEVDILKNIQPDNLKIFCDSNGFVIKIVSGKKSYIP